MNGSRIMTVAFALLLASCTANPRYQADKPHHTTSGFRNLYIDDSEKGIGAFVQWKLEQLTKKLPAAEDHSFPINTSHHAELKNNSARPALTWIGHATFLLQVSGLNILTDPHFSQRASPVSWAGPKRVVEPALKIDQLPDIDAVIISHDHYDSLDVASVKQLAAHNRKNTMHFLVPLGLKTWFDELELNNIHVIELDWTESFDIKGVRFIAEPSQHWGKRSLVDAFSRLWASWVIETTQRRIFFAGDSGYVRHFKNIGNKYGGFDLALIPIGAYEPRWFMKTYHVNPEEAVKIHQDLNARYSVAMHWGTFILTDEPMDEPPIKLAEALRKYDIPQSEFQVFQHGQTRFLDW